MQAVLKTAGAQFFHSGFALPLQLGIAGAKLNFLWGVVLGGVILYCSSWDLLEICLASFWGGNCATSQICHLVFE